MQPAADITYEQSRPMSWLNFISSVLFAFYGTGFISALFISLPLIIYSAGVTDTKQLAFYESLADIGITCLQLLILLLFIYKHKQVQQLLQPIFNFQALKKGSTYGYVLLFLAADWVLYFYVLDPLLPHTGEEQYAALNLEMLEQYPILLLLGSAILVPIVEELIFRGIILRFFQERFPFWIAAIGSSFLFGIAHTYSVGVMINAFIIGMFMAILCKKTNSIIPAILLHMLNNALAFS